MKQSRVRLQSGQIFELSLKPYFYKYSYCKFVKISELIEKASYPYLFRIYDHVVDEPETEIKVLTNCDWLCNSFFVTAAQNIFEVAKLVGKLPLEERDKQIPDLKRGFPLYEEDYSKIKTWQYLEDGGRPSKAYDSSLENVKHLSFSGAFNVTKIRFRIALELYKIDNKDISSYHNLDPLEQVLYNKYQDLPIYQSIPVQIREKAVK